MTGYFDELSADAIAAHDRQREMPAITQRQLIEAMKTLIGTVRACLDAGAGTGAISRPLCASGVPVVALDISRAMLRVLKARQQPGARFPIVHADITRLPFRDLTFGSVHVANTLHLIPDWKLALEELTRVTTSGGVLLFALGNDPSPHPIVVELGQRFESSLHHGKKETSGNLLSDRSDFFEAMSRLDTIQLDSISVIYENVTTPRLEINRLQHNVFAHPEIDNPNRLNEAAEHTRAWAQQTYGDLDLPIVRGRNLTYHAFQRR